MKKKFLQITCILLSASLISCDPYNDNEYREYVVVESYLIADQNLPAVRLSTTMPADEEYSFIDAAITGADVTVQLLAEDDDAEVEASFTYSMANPGIYMANSTHSVLPRRTYLMEADVPGHGQVRGRVTVPDTFRIEGTIRDTIIYQSDNQLELTITKNVNPGRQNVYVFNTIAADPVASNLTPFYRDILDDETDDISDFANNASNLINESNFTVNPDGTIDLKFPWIGVAFFGENQIVTNSLDSNIFDFIRSQDVQLGGSTLSPGEIPNAIYHIEGGIGVFGGVAADTIATYISEPE